MQKLIKGKSYFVSFPEAALEGDDKKAAGRNMKAFLEKTYGIIVSTFVVGGNAVQFIEAETVQEEEKPKTQAEQVNEVNQDEKEEEKPVE